MIYGERGGDTIYGGDGLDVIYGRVGNDSIEGKGKADTIYGGGDNDTILGGAGSDLIYGGTGNDLLYGSLSDGSGEAYFGDTIYGDVGDDTLDGGGRHDTVTNAYDSLIGGDGNETYVFRASAIQQIITVNEVGTTGSDTLDFRYIPTGTVGSPGTMVVAAKSPDGQHMGGDTGMASYTNTTINGVSGTAYQIERVIQRDTCGVLLTGSEPERNFAAWNHSPLLGTYDVENSIDHQHYLCAGYGGDVMLYNNCYAYAANNPLARRGTNKPQPGYKATGSFPDVTSESVKAGAIADGFRYLGLTAAATWDIKQTEYVVTLVLDVGADYHWYRHDPDGMWSHKPGLNQASSVDAAGQSIGNPETANRNYGGLNYDVFVGYFAVQSQPGGWTVTGSAWPGGSTPQVVRITGYGPGLDGTYYV